MEKSTQELIIKGTVLIVVISAMIFGVVRILPIAIQGLSLVFNTNTTEAPATELSTQSTQATLTDTPLPPTGIPTQFITIFDGFFNCRADPSASSPVLVLLQGQEITIIAQNQSGSWLYVSVSGFAEPCWVFRTEIPNLDQAALQLIPVYEETIKPTFTLPPGTQFASTQESDNEGPKPSTPANPFITPDNPNGTPPACSDGIDNDNDGYTDYRSDPQCDSPDDSHENP